MINEKNEIRECLSEMIRNHAQLRTRFQHVDAEFTRERERLRNELTVLQARLSEAAGRSFEPGTGEGRRQAELEARQGLIDEGIERRLQGLQLEWKQERHHMLQKIDSLQKELGTYRLAGGEF